MRGLRTGDGGRSEEDEEEGCEGVGRSGSREGGGLAASLAFFSRLLQRDNDQTLRGCVCSRYSHRCFFYLFLLLLLNVPTAHCHFLKASHAWKRGIE